MAIKTLRVFQEFTSEGYVPMPPLGNIDYGYTVAGTFPGTTPATFQTDNPDIDVTVTEMTDFYVWIRSHGSEWNINYTRNVRVYPDSPLINNVVMGIIIANSENGLPAGGTAGQILSKIDGTDFNAQWIDNMADWTSQLKHTVRAGVALTKGQAVYVSSANGTNMIVSKASNAAESTSSKTLGLVAQNLALNGQGFVITEGLLAGLDTSTATIGDAVWLGTDGNLIYGLANKPIAPAHLVFIGIVTRVNNSNGEIFVKVQNGFELREIHDVLITSPTNNQGLLYDSASTLWKNANVQLPISLTNTGSSGASTFIGNVLNIPNYTLVGLGGVPTTRALSINGTSFDLSADRSWNVGTVTSVGATVPTGFAVSGVPITTSGTLAIAFAAGYSLPTDAKQATWDVAYNNRIVSATLPMVVTGNNVSIYQSSPTSNGYLSSTDWSAFNAKQNALNGSGFVKASGTTITYDNSNYVPTSTTISINGVSYDLSSNRSWTIATSSGTVTSVAATVPTGFAISGSPITTSGTLAITFALGYSLPTDAKQTQWDTAYSNRITSASLPLSISANAISISQANGTTNGYLSSADWTTFNSKQSALSGTGFVKIIGTTISYDNTAYTHASRLLTINGTSYDLTADRSWTITPGSGMRNVQTFTATSGQTTFTITGGYTTGLVDVYVNGARLSSADFTATNGTTVVLGVGVVTNDIVDIVSYTASLSSGINGSGTTNYHAKFTASNVLGNSLLFDDGNAVGIGTNSLSAEGNLFLGAKSATEGGQLVLQKGTSQTYAAHLDNYTDQFRIIAGTNTASSTVRMTIDLLSGATTIAGSLTATTLVKSGGTASQILAADGSVITAGTNITISGGVISSSGGGGGSFLPLAGGTMTGQIVSTFLEAIKLTQGSGYISGWNSAGTTRQGYLQWTNGNAYFAAEAGSNLVLSTQGINRLLINSSGDLSVLYNSYFSGTINTYATQALKMIADSCYIGGFNSAGSIRYGYLQFASGTLNLASEAGAGMQLIVNSGTRIFMPAAGNTGIGTTSPIEALHVVGNVRSSGLVLNANTTANQGHRVYSRTMDVNSYTTATNIRFTVAAGYNVQFQYEVIFHATRTTSGNPAEIWYLRYTAGIAYDTSRNPNERWWDLREQAGNGIAGVGRNNQVGYFEVQNSAFDSGCRLTCVVKVTCNNWDAVTVTFP